MLDKDEEKVEKVSCSHGFLEWEWNVWEHDDILITAMLIRMCS